MIVGLDLLKATEWSIKICTFVMFFKRKMHRDFNHEMCFLVQNSVIFIVHFYMNPKVSCEMLLLQNPRCHFKIFVKSSLKR